MNEFITTILHESGAATKRALGQYLRPELFGEHLLVLPAFSRLKVD